MGAMKNEGLAPAWAAGLFYSMNLGDRWRLTCVRCGTSWAIPKEPMPVGHKIALLDHALKCAREKKKT